MIHMNVKDIKEKIYKMKIQKLMKNQLKHLKIRVKIS